METIIREMNAGDAAAAMAVAQLLYGPQGWFDEKGLNGKWGRI